MDLTVSGLNVAVVSVPTRLKLLPHDGQAMSFIDQLNRVSTVRTSDVHGNTFEGRV